LVRSGLLRTGGLLGSSVLTGIIGLRSFSSGFSSGSVTGSSSLSFCSAIISGFLSFFLSGRVIRGTGLGLTGSGSGLTVSAFSTSGLVGSTLGLTGSAFSTSGLVGLNFSDSSLSSLTDSFSTGFQPVFLLQMMIEMLLSEVMWMFSQYRVFF